MRSRFAILLAIVAVCVTAAWAGFAPEEQITTSRTGKDLRMHNGRKVAIASNGVRHLVWSDWSTVYYNRYYPQSGWTADYKLSGAKNSKNPAVALDPNGTDIHVVWEAGGSIYYQKCIPGASGTGGWVGTPRLIASRSSSVYLTTPSIACYKDANDVHHIAVTWCIWIGPNLVGFCECVNGTWGQPIYMDGPLASRPWYPSIAADPQARYGEVFLSTQSGGGVYVRRRVQGAWQAWEDVAVTGSGSWFIDIDPSTGSPHIVGDAYSHTGIYHTCWVPDGGWLPAETISGSDVIRVFWPSIAFSSSSAFVVWSETTSSAGGVRYSIGNYGNWVPPAWLTNRYYQGEMNCAVAGASPGGDVYTAYMDEVGRYTQLFGRLYTPGGDGGSAEPMAVSQSRIELFPSPAKAGHVTVQYALPHSGPMRVTLLDVSGRTVRSSSFGVRSSGQGSLVLDAGGLNRGVYILKLESGTTSLTRKVVVE